MVHHTERKIPEVRQCLNTFELRLLAQPAPQVGVLTLQDAVESLLANIDKIVEAMVPEYKAHSAEPAEDTQMAALFPTFEIPQPLSLEHAKRLKVREEDEARE